MRIFRIVCLVLLSLLIASCACRARKSGESNVPVAQAGEILKDVNFAFDRYDLSATARQILSANAEWLQANPSVNFEIEGHCDERGTNEYNMALGAKRAQAAMDYLRSLGVAGGRMRTVSYGEELPLDPRHNEEAWAKNRRAHFKVLN